VLHTCASKRTRISRLFLSRPVSLTLRYGSGFSKLLPFEARFAGGEMRPGSGWPYICACFSKGFPSEILSGVGAGRRLGMGELGECGVVGQGGRPSRLSKPAEVGADPRGSYMTMLSRNDRAPGETENPMSASMSLNYTQ
jgi:hypothetical protein